MKRTVLAAVLVMIPTLLGAQSLGRKIEGELSGNAFFGNTRQVLANLRAEYERADSGYAFRAQSRFGYGQTKTDSTTEVTKRSWNVGSNYDWRPFADITPFIRAGVESSLESKIDLRYSVGTGTRWNIVRTERTDVIFSAGVNGEQTTPLTEPDTAGTTTLARGTTTLRLRRDFSERVSATSETTYGPALTESDDYTIVSVNTLRMKLARFAALTLSFRDNYDSQAESRGARTNNDAELMLGLLTSF